MAGNAIVSSSKSHLVAAQKPLDHGNCLCQPLDPSASGFEVQSCLIIFGSHVPGTQAELEPAARQEIDCRSLARQQYRVAKVVIEHVRANSEGRRRFGSADECRHRRQ